MLPLSESGRAHGLRRTYDLGCRCLKCKLANHEYSRERRLRPCRTAILLRSIAHVKRLQRLGFGDRQIADLAGVSRSTVILIRAGRTRSGRTPWVKYPTYKRLLEVRPEPTLLADGALIDPAPVREIIDYFKSEGWTERDVCERMGYKGPAVQLGRKGIRLKTFARWIRFVDRHKPQATGRWTIEDAQPLERPLTPVRRKA